MQNLKDDPKKKEQEHTNVPAEDKGEDQFSPGETDGYNPDDFATD